MATEENLHARIQTLVERGVLYWVQPTENMTSLLERESAKWICTAPDQAPWPWGNGTNEEMYFMLPAAQTALYGLPVTSEWVTGHSGEQLNQITALWSCSRGDGRPWAFGIDNLTSWAEAHWKCGLRLPQTMHAKDLFAEMVSWRHLEPFGATIQESHRARFYSTTIPFNLFQGDVFSNRNIINFALRMSAAWRIIEHRPRYCSYPTAQTAEEVQRIVELPFPAAVQAIVMLGLTNVWTAGQPGDPTPFVPTAEERDTYLEAFSTIVRAGRGESR